MGKVVGSVETLRRPRRVSGCCDGAGADILADADSRRATFPSHQHLSVSIVTNIKQDPWVSCKHFEDLNLQHLGMNIMISV